MERLPPNKMEYSLETNRVANFLDRQWFKTALKGLCKEEGLSKVPFRNQFTDGQTTVNYKTRGSSKVLTQIGFSNEFGTINIYEHKPGAVSVTIEGEKQKYDRLSDKINQYLDAMPSQQGGFFNRESGV